MSVHAVLFFCCLSWQYTAMWALTGICSEFHCAGHPGVGHRGSVPSIHYAQLWTLATTPPHHLPLAIDNALPWLGDRPILCWFLGTMLLTILSAAYLRRAQPESLWNMVTRWVGPGAIIDDALTRRLSAVGRYNYLQNGTLSHSLV